MKFLFSILGLLHKLIPTPTINTYYFYKLMFRNIPQNLWPLINKSLGSFIVIFTHKRVKTFFNNHIYFLVIDFSNAFFLTLK